MGSLVTTPLSIIVYGAGGHAKAVADALRANGYGISVFVDDVTPGREGQIFCGAPVIAALPKTVVQGSGVAPMAMMAFGVNEARLTKARVATSLGYRFPVVVHPRAYVAPNASVGEGTVVCVNASIGPDARVGSHVIVNSAATVDHDCVVGDGVHVGPGAVIAGSVTLGEGTFIGAGAVVIDHVTVGKRCVVGAGAVVIRDVEDDQTVVGVPAAAMTRSH